VYNKLLTLPGNIRIYPGHDYGEKPTITLAENIKISPLLRAKNLKDFQQKMDEYERTRTPGS
jgi:glyoxylase-like metal-dependent hydrolase (beta-lactamase superfamily II)